MSSCSATKTAKRKYRKAEKLMREAGALAPQLADTVFIVERDTVIINKDSIRFETKLLLDTVKVDSIITKLIRVKEEGGDIRALKQEIYEELLPDLNYESRDSLRIEIDEQEHFVRFNMRIVIKDDNLVVTAHPLDNVPFTSIKQEINIDAQKKGRFWKGVLVGAVGILILLLLAWIFRGVLSSAVS